MSIPRIVGWGGHYPSRPLPASAREESPGDPEDAHDELQTAAEVPVDEPVKPSPAAEGHAPLTSARFMQFLMVLWLSLSSGILPVGAAPARARSKEADPGEAFKALLGTPDVVGLAEFHHGGDPALLAALTLEKMTEGGRHTILQREARADQPIAHLAGLESHCNSLPGDGAAKEKCIDSVVNQFPLAESGAPEQSVARLREVLSHEVEFRMMDWNSEKYSLERAVTGEGPRVISSGAAHLMARVDSKGMSSYPCSGMQTPLPARYGSMSLARQQARFDGFSRIGDGEDAILVIPDSIWRDDQRIVREELERQNRPFFFFDTRSNCHKHYARTHTVAEVRIGSFNATVVAPRRYQETFEQARAAYPDDIALITGQAAKGQAKKSESKKSEL